MLTKLLILLFIGLLFEAVAVVCLSRGLKQVGEVQKISAPEVLRVVKAGVTNHYILLGILLEAIYFSTLLVLISKGPVSFVWPLTSLSFMLTTISAKFVLHEEVSGLRWCGVLLIMLGASVITYTEKLAEKKGKAPAPTTVQSTLSQ